MSCLAIITDARLVSRYATLSTYTVARTGQVHVDLGCDHLTSLISAGMANLADLAALDDPCECVNKPAAYKQLLSAHDLVTLGHLTDGSYDAAAPTMRVSRLRYRSYALRHQRNPALTEIAHTTADTAIDLVAAIRGTGLYRADAALQLLRTMETRSPSTRLRLQNGSLLSQLPTHLHDPLAQTVDAVFDEADDDLLRLAHTMGAGVARAAEATTTALERIWEVACRAPAWFRIGDGGGQGGVRPSSLLLGATDDFDTSKATVRIVRLPLAFLWSPTHTRTLRPLTLDGSRTRDQVAAAVRICGNRLDDVDDTLAALDVA